MLDLYAWVRVDVLRWKREVKSLWCSRDRGGLAPFPTPSHFPSQCSHHDLRGSPWCLAQPAQTLASGLRVMSWSNTLPSPRTVPFIFLSCFGLHMASTANRMSSEQPKPRARRNGLCYKKHPSWDYFQDDGLVFSLPNYSRLFLQAIWL